MAITITVVRPQFGIQIFTLPPDSTCFIFPDNKPCESTRNPEESVAITNKHNPQECIMWKRDGHAKRSIPIDGATVVDMSNFGELWKECRVVILSADFVTSPF